jgi:hypothetical protein
MTCEQLQADKVCPHAWCSGKVHSRSDLSLLELAVALLLVVLLMFMSPGCMPVCFAVALHTPQALRQFL